MITGNINVERQYRDLIVSQMEKELNLTEEKTQLVKNRLNGASSDDLERIYNAFARFGVQTIMESII